MIAILSCITQLVLWSQPLLRSNSLDQPVHRNEAGWELPAPLVSCSSAVPCDIHLLSLVWLVNLGWREMVPPLIASAQRAAFNSVNGRGKLCLCHHSQTAHLNHAMQLPLENVLHQHFTSIKTSSKHAWSIREGQVSFDRFATQEIKTFSLISFSNLNCNNGTLEITLLQAYSNSSDYPCASINQYSNI